jgi:CRP/FNR family transcriptional regulator, cyclic AMP receptor protein
MEARTFIDALRVHPFVEGMKESYVLKIADMAMEVQFARDQTVFREGDLSGLFYLVLSGKLAVEVSAPGRIVRIQTVGTGDEFGWSALLGAEKQFQVRALEPVRALALDGERLRQACAQDPAFGYQVMTRALRLVAARLQAARLQLLDLYAPRGTKMV